MQQDKMSMAILCYKRLSKKTHLICMVNIRTLSYASMHVPTFKEVNWSCGLLGHGY